MAIHTRLLKGVEVPEQDRALVAALNEALPKPLADGEAYIAGFRNPQGQIYRTVVVAGLAEMMQAIRTVSRLGYELEMDRPAARDGVDAVFRFAAVSGSLTKRPSD